MTTLYQIIHTIDNNVENNWEFYTEKTADEKLMRIAKEIAEEYDHDLIEEDVEYSNTFSCCNEGVSKISIEVPV